MVCFVDWLGFFGAVRGLYCLDLGLCRVRRGDRSTQSRSLLSSWGYVVSIQGCVVSIQGVCCVNPGL
mgnify:CR=1 FL=1